MLAAVPVAHAREDLLPVDARGEGDLRDLGEALPENVAVFRDVGPETVPPDLLVEGQILLRAFAGVGIARVVDRVFRGGPRGVSARGSAVHARDLVGEPLAGVDAIDEERAVLRPVLRERHRDVAAGRRGLEEVDRDSPLRIDRVRIDENPLIVCFVERFEHNEERLLLGRLSLDREGHAAAADDAVVRRCLGAHELLHAFGDRLSRGMRFEAARGVVVLGSDPREDFRIGEVLHVPIVVDHVDSPIPIDHGARGRERRRRDRLGRKGRGRREDEHENQTKGGLRSVRSHRAAPSFV